MKALVCLLLNLSLVELRTSAKLLDCNKSKERNYEFYLLRKFYRSTGSILALGNFEKSSECANMTQNSNGLAFNFSPTSRKNFLSVREEFSRKSARLDILEQPEEFYNCIALKCPESVGFSNLIQDSRFDFYSLYTNPLLPQNANCLPEIGVFQIFSNPVNYSTAYRTCITKSKGALAHVVSEIRTREISKLLKTKNNMKFAYVGLNFSKEISNQFITSQAEKLKCFLFRAWEVGSPRINGNFSCVAITAQNSWITTDCEKKLPFICEIFTSGPP